MPEALITSTIVTICSYDFNSPVQTWPPECQLQLFNKTPGKYLLRNPWNWQSLQSRVPAHVQDFQVYTDAYLLTSQPHCRGVVIIPVLRESCVLPAGPVMPEFNTCTTLSVSVSVLAPSHFIPKRMHALWCTDRPQVLWAG